MDVPVIRNVSPMGDLYVPALGLDVAAGAEVPVADVALAAALLAQVGVWAPANDTAEKIIADAAKADAVTDTPEEG